MATFRLPLPPSANLYWRRGARGMYVSEAAREYKTQAGWIARAEGVEPISGAVRLSLDVYMTNVRADLSNRIKVCEDALNGVAYHDDQQVTEIHARRFQVPKQKRGVKREGYVIVTVEEAA